MPKTPMRRVALFLGVVALLVGATGCGSEEEDGSGSNDPETTETTATADDPGGDDGTTSPPDDGGDDPSDLARPATMSWGDQERTFALVMCDNPQPEYLLVSGSDDEGYTILIEVTDGSGAVYVSEPVSLESAVEGDIEGFSVQDDGTFSTTGSATAANGATEFTLEGSCGAPPG